MTSVTIAQVGNCCGHLVIWGFLSSLFIDDANFTLKEKNERIKRDILKTKEILLSDRRTGRYSINLNGGQNKCFKKPLEALGFVEMDVFKNYNHSPPHVIHFYSITDEEVMKLRKKKKDKLKEEREKRALTRRALLK